MRSIVALEDPVEQLIDAIDQSQIDPESGFGWPDGLRALLRQDPEVVFIGEVRDPLTAEALFQSALTGQLVVSTMHARSAADALRRLLDFGVASYHLISGLEALLCQRLLQRWCACRREISAEATGSARAASLDRGRRSASGSVCPAAADCPRCSGTGIDGRILIAETLPLLEGPLARALAADPSSRRLQELCCELGMQPLEQMYARAVAGGTAVPHPDFLSNEP